MLKEELKKQFALKDTMIYIVHSHQWLLSSKQGKNTQKVSYDSFE